jgi:hypothetical protein
MPFPGQKQGPAVNGTGQQDIWERAVQAGKYRSWPGRRPICMHAPDPVPCGTQRQRVLAFPPTPRASDSNAWVPSALGNEHQVHMGD